MEVGEADQAILQSICPFPFIMGRDLIDGFANAQPSCCRNCTHQDCRQKEVPENTHSLCREGLSFYRTSWNSDRVTLNGLIVSRLNNAVSGDRRKGLRRLWTTDEAVKEFLNRLPVIEKSIQLERLDAARESVSFLHDVRSSVAVLLKNCEEVIAASPGDSFNSKLQNSRYSNEPLFTLYSSINLLVEQLNFADIISNPDSIKFGSMSSSELHPFFYKFVKLFEASAATRRIRIMITGTAYGTVRVYQSLQLLPLILLDNAVKYAEAGTIITVHFSQQAKVTEIRVSSTGETVHEYEQDRIFEKFIRGSNAEGRHAHGTGLGLFVAREILKAHGFTIRYESDRTDGSRGQNSFIVRIPND